MLLSCIWDEGEFVLSTWSSGRASLKVSIPLQNVFVVKSIAQEILVWRNVYLLFCGLQGPYHTAQLLRRRASICGIGASVSCRSQSRTFDKCLFWATQQNKTKRHKQWPCLRATDKDSLANYFCAWTVGRKSTRHLALKPDQGSLKITVTTQKELMNAVVQIFSVDSERSRG